MTPLVLRAAAVVALFAAASVPSLAGSIAASSAAGGSSASSATSAASDSSANSARAVAQADGPYRVVDVTPVPERPGTVRLKLQALAGGADGAVRGLELSLGGFRHADAAKGLIEQS
jgi:hypothetical protein